ncbi:hypothetical protein Amal_03757 [Acetobacter malorum]|uniref:Uncharacterized protein n=1 Tax=Acetobacter malorum TaxID=178901 RepID=A0A177G5L8_9PROT|nr:hypothetical protein Amal_03757 [Acetobacter malorum]
MFLHRAAFRHGPRHEGLHNRENIFHPVAEFFIQHPLARVGLRTLLQLLLVIGAHHFNQPGTDEPGGFQIIIRPGEAFFLHLFFPDRKAGAGGQAWAKRAVYIGFVRVTAPVQCLEDFAPEQEDIILRLGRDRDDHHTCYVWQESRRIGGDAGQMVCMPDMVPGTLMRDGDQP